MKDFFKPEDFEEWENHCCKAIADFANAKLNKEIAKWPITYRYEPLAKRSPDHFIWSLDDSPLTKTVGLPPSYTATARLAFVEEIKPKECDHEIYAIGYNIKDNKPIYHADCTKCGKKLKPTWSEV